MREIIFRGKDKLGHWLYGGFHLWKTRQPCVCNDELKPEEIKHIIIKNSFADWNMPRTMQPYEVVPETVGQYTGLTDKNGTKIFEGDIVQSIELELKGIIVFDEHCRFMIKDFSTGSTYLISYNNDEIQVIGNIHDNPELLESEVNNNV